MEVLEVLRQSVINNNIVTLPDVKLDRKTYQDVAKKIELIGGKWNRKTKGFLFPEDPTGLFFDVCNGESRNLKKEFQFFETPDDLADVLCSYIPEKTEHILEPSAGRGSIVRVINKKSPLSKVFFCELMELNRKMFKGNALYLSDDFLEFNHEILFDCIVANPPFSKNQDITHFMKMYDICKNGGRIISIMSKHWQLSNNKKETAFREFLESNDSKTIEIEAGKFKKSGTNIATCIVVLDKT